LKQRPAGLEDPDGANRPRRIFPGLKTAKKGAGEGKNPPGKTYVRILRQRAEKNQDFFPPASFEAKNFQIQRK
jgi:hypothetical protein